MLKSVRLFLLFSFIFTGCSKYQKILKSSDFDLKYEMAVKYFDEGQDAKALPLFEELISIYRGTGKAEKILYYYAYCNYNMGDYILASYHFKNFARTYPNSVHAEECLYLNAYCHYLSSPTYSLDQESTIEAIKEFQIFINSYPQSTRITQCNDLMDKLRFKLERKSYDNAKIYYNISDYKAAIVAFNNAIKDYPSSPFIEEMSFLVVKSHYLLAENSIEEKKKERYQASIEAYHSFIDRFPNSKYLKDAENIYENSLKQKNKTT